MNTSEGVKSEIYPLIWSDDVGALLDWAIAAFDMRESWRASSEEGQIEHGELNWGRGKVSINISNGRRIGPSGISLRVEDRILVDEIYQRAVAAGVNITQELEESMIAYSFAATDQDGNYWWVNAETGFLDKLRV
ncbi:MAG: putative glyoxalase superfamily protein PhnB [Candidatus Azotimanducaceae bacterium]|jgi:uncharacterized glyoxalase superfamily protein PhnB